MHARRFNGPLKVKATPNLAVRVGKTQSAWGRSPIFPQSRDGYVGKTHHVNAQRYTDQKICSSGQLVKTESKLWCDIDPPQSQYPLNTVVLIGDMNLMSCRV